MAVAITCGYGGYLLPLLAAHSSSYLHDPITHVLQGYFPGIGAIAPMPPGIGAIAPMPVK